MEIIRKCRKFRKKLLLVFGQENYALYDVRTDDTQFLQAGYKSEKKFNGFGGL